MADLKVNDEQLQSNRQSVNSTFKEDPEQLRRQEENDAETGTGTAANTRPVSRVTHQDLLTEKGGVSSGHTETSQSAGEEDVLIVDWDGPDDPANPKK